MVEGVIAHDVPLLGHAADHVGGGLDHIAHHEKGSGGPVLFQGVQNGVGIAVLIAAVERKIDDFFGRVPQKAGVVVGQLLGAGVAHGGLALLREGQAPVVRGGGDGRRTGGGGQGLLCVVVADRGGQDQAQGQPGQNGTLGRAETGHEHRPPGVIDALSLSRDVKRHTKRPPP